MDLIWKVPSLAVVISGGLLTFAFSAHLPAPVRALVLLVGAAFMLVMTISLERYRMFQFRRRKDLEDIESELAAFGARALSWGGNEIVRQIRSRRASLSRAFPCAALRASSWMRGLMYFSDADEHGVVRACPLRCVGLGTACRGLATRFEPTPCKRTACGSLLATLVGRGSRATLGDDGQSVVGAEP